MNTPDTKGAQEAHPSTLLGAASGDCYTFTVDSQNRIVGLKATDVEAVWPHVMVDIETMSTHSSEALFLSVALVAFRLTKERPIEGPRLLLVPDIARQLLAGRRVDPKTQTFWRDQPDAASGHWVAPLDGERCAPEAIHALVERWLKANMASGYQVWANGAVFDIGNLENLFQATPNVTSAPWPYNAVRDYRTLVRALPELRVSPAPAAAAIHPDPVAACLYQIGKLWRHAPASLLEGGAA